VHEISGQIAELKTQARETQNQLETLIGIVGTLAAIVNTHQQRLERIEGQ